MNKQLREIITTHPGERRNMARNQRDFVLKHLHFEKIGKRLVDFVDRHHLLEESDS